MSSLLPVNVYIVVCEDGAAHRSYTDSLVAHAHLLSLIHIYFIEEHAIAWAVGVATVQEIQQINILHASMLAMQRAIEALPCTPERLLIDGNYYDPRPDEVEYHTIVKGDDRYLAIAAASILAKTHRDEYMTQQAQELSLIHI